MITQNLQLHLRENRLAFFWNFESQHVYTSSNIRVFLFLKFPAILIITLVSFSLEQSDCMLVSTQFFLEYFVFQFILQILQFSFRLY